MNEEKRIQILHDIKRIANLFAERQKSNEEIDKRIETAFDTLYKDLESEMINDISK